MKKTAIAAAFMLVTGVANAAQVSTGGVFTMFSQQGLDQATATLPSGAPVNVDPSVTGWVDEDAGTWQVESTALFFGLNWTASGGTLVSAPGNYALDVNTGVLSNAAPDNTGTADGSMHFTVGAGEIGGIIDFAYGVTTGIKVIDVWSINGDGSLTAKRGPGMENGPFPGFNAAFDLTAPGLVSAVPVPAAVWLFGSGLLGLVGVARRRKAA